MFKRLAPSLSFFVLLTLARGLGTTAAVGCEGDTLECSQPDQLRCDFYVEAAMRCTLQASGDYEWETAVICPLGRVCTIPAGGVTEINQACVDPLAPTDAAATDVSEPDAEGGDPDSVEDFIDLIVPEGT